MMKKNNGFTFVELLLAMVVLGVIAVLTIPLIKDMGRNYKTIVAYRQKATQDVTDAISLALMNNRQQGWTDFAYANADSFVVDGNAGNAALQAVINDAVSGTPCVGPACLENLRFGCNDGVTDDEHPAVCNENTTLPNGILGITKRSGKHVMLFVYTGNNANNANTVYGNIYIDVNGNAGPNTFCEDRFKFNLLKDTVEMDKTANGVGCPDFDF